ncbi:hypothetical protein [Salinicola avicenniae]|uniref:hypothetical protein n=1 Tax=Salinicola avicenniae TaxID=2916836 RepID=UPI0020740950|nr:MULTISPECIES: hypothetical protein [unclassified Salinicola]
MRHLLLPALVGALSLAVLAGCTVNTYGQGQREVKAGVPEEGPTANPADASRGPEGSGAMP